MAEGGVEDIQVDGDEGLGTLEEGPFNLVNLLQQYPGLQAMDPQSAQAFSALIQQMVNTAVQGAGGGHGGAGGGADGGDGAGAAGGGDGFVKGNIGRLPLYPPKQAPGEAAYLPDFSRHITAIKTYLSLRQIVNPSQQKNILYLSLEGGAARRLSEDMAPASTECQPLDFAGYVDKLSSIFEPTSDSELARASFQSAKQGPHEDVQSYFVRKRNLFRKAYSTGSEIHFIDAYIASLYHPKVREEVLRTKPSTYAQVYSSSCDAVAFIRRIQGPGAQQQKGLSSVLGFENLGHNAAEPMELGQITEAAEQGPEEASEWSSEELSYLGSMEEEDDVRYWESINQLTSGGSCWHCNSPSHKRKDCPERLKAAGRRDQGSRGSFRGFSRGGFGSRNRGSSFSSSSPSAASRGGARSTPSSRPAASRSPYALKVRNKNDRQGASYLGNLMDGEGEEGEEQVEDSQDDPGLGFQEAPASSSN